MPSSKSFWTHSGTILGLVAVGGLITIGLVLASATWASRESDFAALERQRQLVNGRLHTQLDSVASELTLMAGGYAAAIDVSGTADKAESDRLTAIVRSIFKYDEAFVVGEDGHLFLHEDAETVSRFDWIRPLVLPLLDRAVRAPSRNESLTRPVVELMRLQGRPSIAGVASIGTGGQGPYLVAYRYLDGAALDALSNEQGLNGARFARSADPEPEEVTFQIDATASGGPIGFIIWTPDLPGSKVIVGLLPALTIAAAIIIALLAGLVFLLRKSWADLRDSEQKAQHRSLHDTLTDLPNRAMFARRLERALRDRNAETPDQVALVDLDRFKAVNDTFGHAAGDEVLQAVASRIQSLLGANDMVARLGGDEFALLLHGDLERSAAALCNQIVDELRRPFALLGGKAVAHIGCSIGIAAIAPGPHTASEMLHMADLALYDAKSNGRGRWVEYVGTMDRNARHREALASDLRAVLDEAAMHDDAGTLHRPGTPGIEVFFQTIHRAGNETTISGAEALVRWRHQTLGLLSPDRFIAIAEDSGLMLKLGEHVLRQACLAAINWPETVKLSVNVSPTQLRTPHFADDVLRVLDETGLPPSRLELEVTETALMEGEETVVQSALMRLRKHGIKIALDDFGTGYSSLSHLIQFGIDRLKIDRSFVQLLGTRSDGAAVVSAVVALSHSLGLSTTAEGVETAGQRDFLVAAGCTDLQGYLFARPESAPASLAPSATGLPTALSR